MYSIVYSTKGGQVFGGKVIYDPKTKTNKSTGKVTKYDYYHCADGRRHHKNNNIKQVNVQENVIWAQFGEAIDYITINEELAQRIYRELVDLEKNNHQLESLHREKINLALDKVSDRKIKLYEDYTSELLDEFTYKRLLKKNQHR